MRIIAILIICITLGIAMNLSADPMRYPYWQMIKEVIENIESQPPTPVTIADNNYKTNIEYPFELLRHLRTTDLLNAAVEGAKEARLQAALGKPREELDTLVLNNVTLALEYLPILIRNERDLEEIALLLEKRDQDPVLRMYILENSYPGIAPPSFFSLSFAEFLRENDTAFSKAILEIAKHPMESPEMQLLALNIYNNRLLDSYEKRLEKDPIISEIIRNDRSRNAIKIATDNFARLSEESQNSIKKYCAQFHDFSFNISGHIAKGSIRDERVKAKTRQIIESIRDTVIGSNKEILNMILDGKPFNSTPFTNLQPRTSSPFDLQPIHSSERIDVLMKNATSGKMGKTP